MPKTLFKNTAVDSRKGYFVNGTEVINESGVVTGTLAETAVRYAEVSLTSANIKALRATPKELVAAPGAGKFIELISAQLLLDATATAYTESADNMAIKYENGSGTTVSETIEATGFIDQTADTILKVAPAASAATAATAAVNKALVLHNTGDGEYATGTGVMRAKIAYRVHTTGF